MKNQIFIIAVLIVLCLGKNVHIDLSDSMIDVDLMLGNNNLKDKNTNK